MAKLTKLHLAVGVPAFGVLLLIGLGANVASAEPSPTVPTLTTVPTSVPTDTSGLTVPVTTDTQATTVVPTTDLTTSSPPPTSTSTAPTTTSSTSSSPPPTTTSSTSTAPGTTSTTASTTAPSTTPNPTTQGTTGATSSPQNPLPTAVTITAPNGGVQTITQDPSAPLPAQGLFLGAAVGGADRTGQLSTPGAGARSGSGSGTVPWTSGDLITQASLESETVASGPGPTRILIVTLLAVAALTGLIYGYTRWYDAHR